MTSIAGVQILFADRLDADGIARLRSEGHTCVERPELGTDDLPDALADAEVVVVRSTQVTAAAIAAAPHLGLIVRAGAGTDNIDVAAASGAGVYVCNVPGRNAIAVAELTLGLLLAVDRRIADNATELRSGRWDKATYSTADGVYGKRLALIGLGEIGMAVATRARAFGMEVTGLRKPGRAAGADQRITDAGVTLVDTLEELLTTADVVSLHLPGGPDTAGMVDAGFLARIRPGSILLNTSRGDIIDEAALLEALDGGLRAGLDVYRDEPSSSRGRFDSPLARHPNVVGTHHIGASTAQAQRAVAEGTIDVIRAYGAGEVRHCINLEPAALGTHTLSVRHLDRVGVLAGVLGVLRGAGCNVETMQNRVFLGRRAAVADICVDGPVDDALVAAVRSVDHVLGVSLTTRSAS